MDEPTMNDLGEGEDEPHNNRDGACKANCSERDIEVVEEGGAKAGDEEASAAERAGEEKREETDIDQLAEKGDAVVEELVRQGMKEERQAEKSRLESERDEAYDQRGAEAGATLKRQT